MSITDALLGEVPFPLALLPPVTEALFGVDEKPFPMLGTPFTEAMIGLGFNPLPLEILFGALTTLDDGDFSAFPPPLPDFPPFPDFLPLPPFPLELGDRICTSTELGMDEGILLGNSLGTVLVMYSGAIMMVELT